MANFDRDWIIRRLERFTQEIDGVVDAGQVSDDVDNDFRAMTVLKLSVISAAVDVYSKIAVDNFETCYYIDALAGSGVTRIRNNDDYVFGSPLIAPIVAHNEFPRRELLNHGLSRPSLFYWLRTNNQLQVAVLPWPAISLLLVLSFELSLDAVSNAFLITSEVW